MRYVALTLLTIFIGVQNLALNARVPVNTSFTYQGRLNFQGAPADGEHVFEFGLYDAPTQGYQIQTTVSAIANVRGGLFSANLNFGPDAFSGDRRWLEVDVRPSGSNDLINLSPRTEISPAPHAGYAVTAGNALNLGGFPSNSYSRFKWLPALSDVQAEPETGYVITGSSLINVRLPQTMDIGDTFRVSGVGAGGWKILQNSNQLINCSALNIPTAQQTWTEHTKTIPTGPYIYMNSDWRDITSSADGSRLAACTYNYVFTSNDYGSTWFRHATNQSFRFIASSADGSRLIAAPDNGYLYVSSDYGATWNQRESQRTWYSVFISEDGTRMAACGNGIVHVSSDFGLTWAPRLNYTVTAICGSTDGRRLAACQNNYIHLSEDYGVSWTQKYISQPGSMRSIACSADGGRLVAVGYNGAFLSADRGETWSKAILDTTYHPMDVSMSADGSRISAVGPNMQIQTSVDFGKTWVSKDSVRSWRGITSSADGKRLAACVSVGFIYTSVESPLEKTTLGIEGFLAGYTSSAVELQYVGNNTFMPLSYVGEISAK